MNLRPYQIEIGNQLEAGWKEASKQLVVSTMGSGKTICFAQQAKKVCNAGHRTLILVDQDELARQAVEKIEETADLKCEVEKAERSASKFASVVVASVQSMVRRLDNWPQNHFGLIIADEADKSLAPTWQRCLKHFDGTAKVAGFTATPHRGDLRSLGEYYERIAFEAYFYDFVGSGKWAFDIVEGQRVQKNWVAPFRVEMLPIKIDVSGKGAGKDFTDDEADEIITPHLEEIAKAILVHGSFKRTLVFLPLIKTCERFSEIARDVGLSAEHISGEDSERDEKLERFKRWEFDVLSNSMLLTRGVDIPGVEVGVIARVTKSISLYQQMAGRLTRLFAGKANALLLDFLYQAVSKMVCRPANLIAKTQEEADQITALLIERSAGIPGDVADQLDLMKVAADASSQREEALRKKLEEHKHKQAKTISAEEFAMQHHSLEAAEFEPVMKWESDAISDKQAKYLKQAGIDVSTVRGKGHASKLLSLYFAHKPLKSASAGQKGMMKRLGHPNWAHATEREAKQFFAELNQQKRQPEMAI